MTFQHQTSSVLVSRKEATPFSEINFLIEIAWQYAKKGLLVFILSRKIIDENSDINLIPYISRPEILQRIIFRYFNESAELLQWCHEIHKHSKIPQLVLLSGLEIFSSPNDFTTVEICAALLDAMQYCSHFSKKPTYLLISICDNKSDACPTHLVSFFDRIWYLINTQSDMYTFSQLYPSFPGEPQRRININIQGTSSNSGLFV